jgi:hypothetical protein
LENLGQPTILLGTSTFDDKARAELRAWGFADQRYLSVPHNYIDLPRAHFNEVVHNLAQEITSLVGCVV